MVNKVIIIGRLGRDPETTYTPSGIAITKFSVATTEKWKDKNSGEYQERNEWHNIVTFGRIAEICGEYLSKGSLAYFEGKLQTSSWESDGIARYKTEIVANTMQMLGGKNEPATNSTATGSGTKERPKDDIPF